MITRYKDHAANERTYLAWIRTGVTVMVLGFFIEKFELFLASISHLVNDKTVIIPQSPSARIISVILVALGLAVIALGTIHYIRTKAAICDKETALYFDLWLPIALSAGLFIFGGLLLLSLMHII